MSESPTISYTLEEFLLRFEQRVERQFSELNQKMDRQYTELTQRIDKLDEKMDRQYAELTQRIDKLDEKMDRQYAELNQKMDRQYAELNQKMDRQYAELNQKISDVSGDVRALGEQVKGIDKRLETLEFILRGGVVTFLTGSVGLLLNAFGVFSNFSFK
ncbi:hypothetical protein GlitD10_1461 [Gloeomargarita lithophora Alchichica-D10]|uniref:Uncharacterized protein n=1 Tax=Gloeomargarita lithophora Alchichica-D10 TaxID=1188229 RepID=A0A1J0ACZ9_9CYAN|nr:hypothetical protein [Gloeomargarita lithophora]APB33783.1 hypothetical protein GlitD10_1461 [Gloeomargarita lithophora Alchichica-D10]